jgi:hypothetical protein
MPRPIAAVTNAKDETAARSAETPTFAKQAGSPPPPLSGKLDPAADFSNDMCAVTLLPDGRAEITLIVEAEVMRRIQTRAYKVDLADYVWINIYKRAALDHVY